jgi:transcriptional regulator with XRE-family HTH domain
VLRNSQQPPYDPVALLGARVRELRRDRGMTLKELGLEAGLSHPFLSQLERGLARPSMGSVERIARALEVPVTTLWTTPRQEAAHVLRANEGVIQPHHDPAAPGQIRELVADGTSLRVREWSGGGRTWRPEEGATTTGEVLVYVVRGSLDVDLDGTVHTLHEGDSLFFAGSVPHRLRRRGGKRTRALYVATG